MKANELMIGDWVKLKDTPVNVCALNYWKVGYIDNGEAQPLYDGLCFKPIPLTEEILNANAVLFFEGDDWKEKWDNCFDSEYDPKYVHELQHALRLCGLNELADNFKIE